MEYNAESKPINFEHLYEITDENRVSMYEISFILNFYKLILTLQNHSCYIHIYKCEDKSIALKDIVSHFYHMSIHEFEQLYLKHISTTEFCETANDAVEALNNHLQMFGEHFFLKKYYQLSKIESKNDWISPRINSDWDVKFVFEKRYRD